MANFKININGQEFELEFDFNDEGGGYTKWHNFGTSYGKDKEFYIIQITQYGDDEPNFSMAKYTLIETGNFEGLYDAYWNTMEYYINDSDEIARIQEYLIAESDKLIVSN